jgi:hypothetical protein
MSFDNYPWPPSHPTVVPPAPGTSHGGPFHASTPTRTPPPPQQGVVLLAQRQVQVTTFPFAPFAPAGRSAVIAHQIYHTQSLHNGFPYTPEPPPRQHHHPLPPAPSTRIGVGDHETVFDNQVIPPNHPDLHQRIGVGDNRSSQPTPVRSTDRIQVGRN